MSMQQGCWKYNVYERFQWCHLLSFAINLAWRAFCSTMSRDIGGITPLIYSFKPDPYHVKSLQLIGRREKVQTHHTQYGLAVLDTCIIVSLNRLSTVRMRTFIYNICSCTYISRLVLCLILPSVSYTFFPVHKS